MPSYSKTIIIGHLGKDPEVRYTNSGFAICSFTVATSEKWKDKQTGEKKEETEWHRCVVMGTQAERAAEWLHKGSLVMVEGQNRTTKWQDKEGNDRYTTEIKVWKFSPLDPPNRSAKPAQQQAGTDFDDDLPF